MRGRRLGVDSEFSSESVCGGFKYFNQTRTQTVRALASEPFFDFFAFFVCRPRPPPSKGSFFKWFRQVPRHATHVENLGTAMRGTTNFGYFFANCKSSKTAAGLIDVLEREGYECSWARVQGFDLNVAKFYSGSLFSQAWISRAGVWRCIERGA